ARTAATLSGGERARVALAMMMLSRANLLIFDEPTNHLDVESIEAIEDAIEGYEGTVILVSHDRALLRALCNRVWVLHDTHITDFPGSFSEWEVVSEEREHAARVNAESEEELRRVHEKQKTRRRESDVEKERATKRTAKRTADQKTERAELRVAELETKVAELTHTLEDPSLYGNSDGTARAVSLGKELDRAKRALDRALEEWNSLAENAAGHAS
ncbi:MAG: ATP-binding cassette domain-containing protein, partial [Gemmatimonadaceae bacterium]